MGTEARAGSDRERLVDGMLQSATWLGGWAAVVRQLAAAAEVRIPGAAGVLSPIMKTYAQLATPEFISRNPGTGGVWNSLTAL